MNSIIQRITDWLKGILVSGIMDNLTNTFSSVNDQVGQIATEVGKTPSNFMPAVFNMVRNLSESVIMPVAGILLTFIACYELIQLIISYNNLASFETWFIWKWIFKTFVAVELITHTFDITMAVFDVSQSVVRQAGGIIQGSTAVDASTLATMQSTLEAMELGPLFAIFLQSFIVQFLMYVLSAVIFVIINGRMVEIYLMVSLAPLPFATFGNREQSMMGQNYMRSLFALGFQGFLIMVERVSKDAIEALNSKEIIMIFPSQKKNNKTVRVLKSPKTDSSKRKVFIPKSVAQCLIDLKKDQEEIIEALGNEYQNYNLVMATTFGLPIGDSYLRTKMQDIIDELGLPDVVFHSLRHTSVTYKLKLSGGDIKAVQGDSGHAQADMVTEVYGHILDEDRRKNAELMENAFYNKENLNPQMKAQDEGNSTITVPDGVDAELLMKVLGNPEMAALLTSLAKTMKV